MPRSEYPQDPDEICFFCRLGPWLLLIEEFDGAHNQDASKALSATVQEVFPETRRIVVLGMLGPREPAEVINELVPLHPEMVICCTIPSARAISGEVLAETPLPPENLIPLWNQIDLKNGDVLVMIGYKK